ncbi:MAG: SH3 domain-containing protein [Alphaproteobacteria bacterium]|nr:SH3 domain-containing protein [Alphaproteobacteria bacterium]
MMEARTSKLCLAVLCGMATMAPLPAHATTEGTCFQVRNVQQDDVLNIRQERSARSSIVGVIPPEQHGIIALEGRCEPTSVALDSRWCRIAYYDGDATARGYVKRRYLYPSECP